MGTQHSNLFECPLCGDSTTIPNSFVECTLNEEQTAGVAAHVDCLGLCADYIISLVQQLKDDPKIIMLNSLVVRLENLQPTEFKKQLFDIGIIIRKMEINTESINLDQIRIDNFQEYIEAINTPHQQLGTVKDWLKTKKIEEPQRVTDQSKLLNNITRELIIKNFSLNGNISQAELKNIKKLYEDAIEAIEESKDLPGFNTPEFLTETKYSYSSHIQHIIKVMSSLREFKDYFN